MKYRVVVVMNCTYLVEADSPDEAEQIVVQMYTPATADDITIIETTVEQVQ